MSERNINVLIAEDDLEIAELLRTTLSRHGLSIQLVHDGAAALESAHANKPDLILLDVMMPEMNGWEVCKALRSEESFDDVGILMLTAIGPNLNEMTAPLYGARVRLLPVLLIDGAGMYVIGFANRRSMCAVGR